MRTTLRFAGLVVSLVVLTPLQAANAGGLRCSVGEVVLENLKIGHRYSLQSLANLPLSVTNTGEHPVGVTIDALIPGESELRGGAEAIPDAKWAHVSPDTLALRPGESATADMVLDLPDDAKLLGRKFEVIFWSHTLPDPTDFVGVGIKSRVIFSVDSLRDTTESVPAGDLGIEMESATIEMTSLKPGHMTHLESLSTRPLTIRNTSKRTLTVQLEVRPVSPELRANGDLLSVAAVKLVPNVMTLAPGEQRTITGTVTARSGRRPHGRTYRCTVAASVRDLPVRTEIQAQLTGIVP